MELAEPSIEQAFDKCVAQGATFVVVHPYFLAPGRHSRATPRTLIRAQCVQAAAYRSLSVSNDPLRR